MLKVRVVLTFFVALVFCFAATSVAQAQGKKQPVPNQIGWNLETLEIGFDHEGSIWSWPEKSSGVEQKKDFSPKDGDTKYDFTYYKNSIGRSLVGVGWCKIMDQGKTRYWEDKNGNNKIDADEIKEVPYMIWFHCSSVIPRFTDVVEKDGFFPEAKKIVEEVGSNLNLSKCNGIGDLAYCGIRYDTSGGKQYDDCEMCYALRGPFVIGGIELRIFMQVGDFIPIVQLNPDQLDLFSTDKRYLDGASLVKKLKSLRPALSDETVRIAKAIVAELDKWYELPVSNGPDVKGLYLDAGRYLPRLNELPAGLKQTNFYEWDHPAKYPPRIAIVDYERQVDQLRPENYSIGLEIASINPNAPTADQPLLDAHELYLEKPKQNPYYKDFKPITIPGADEAMQSLSVDVNGYRSEMIVLRQANLVAVIKSSEIKLALDRMKLEPLRLGMPIAKKILSKMGAVVQAVGPEASREARIVLTATPDGLWSDGASTAAIRIEAIGPDAKPIANTRFTLKAASPFVGDLELDYLITNNQGIAEGIYKVGRRPGENTIIAESSSGKAEAVIKQGGIVIEPEQKGQLQIFADGQSQVPLVMRCLDFKGKPIANTSIKLSLESEKLPATGAIEPEEGATDKNGIFKAVYTSPEIPVEELKGGASVDVIAQASVGIPARNIQDTFPINIYTGESYMIMVEKQGYNHLDKVSFQSSFRNGTVTGQVVTPSSSSESAQKIPLVFAKVLVLTTVDNKIKTLGSSETDQEGKFTVKFVGEQVTTGKVAEAELKEPIEMNVEDSITDWLKKGQNELEKLQNQKISAPQPAVLFYQQYYKFLAESNSFNIDRQKATEYLVNAPAFMCLFLSYIRQLDNAHSESLEWVIESMKAAADCIFQIADLGDKVETMQDGLSDFYNTNPSFGPARDKLNDTWKKLKEKAVAKFLLEAYDLAQAEYEGIKDDLDTYEALGIPTDSGKIGAKKSVKEIADTYGAQWLFDPAGAIAEKGEEYLKEKVNNFLARILTGSYPEDVAWVLKVGSERIYSGKVTWGNYEHPRELARPVYAAYMEKHNQLNIANLDSELYRLDFKLAVDTIGKGIVLYQSAKDSLKDPKNFQKNITESLKTVDKAFAILDTAYQAYKGRDWGIDCGRARGAMAEITELITRTK